MEGSKTCHIIPVYALNCFGLTGFMLAIPEDMKDSGGNPKKAETGQRTKFARNWKKKKKLKDSLSLLS